MSKYFLGKERLYPGSRSRIADELLERYKPDYIAAQRTHEVTFAWQGGEPTLPGLPFFRRALELQKQYCRPSMTLSTSFQPPAPQRRLVGLSFDGPEQLHDATG